MRSVEPSNKPSGTLREREGDRLAQAEQRRVEETQRREERDREEATRRLEEDQRRAAAEEQAARRTRIEIERDIALLTFLGHPSEDNRNRLTLLNPLTLLRKLPAG